VAYPRIRGRSARNTVTHEGTGDAAAASMHLVHELMTLAQSDVEEGRVRLLV
jgi:hypothetical protein